MIYIRTCAYNAEKTLQRAVDSVLNQTYQDFEYHILDNGSTDQSATIAQAYEARDPRVHSFSIPKSSIGTGRNYGAARSTGGFITFLDDDDWMEPDMLEFLLKLAKKHQAEISLCEIGRAHV